MQFFATCARGTEGPLRSELAALKLKHLRGERGGVAFAGDLEAGMKACLHSRVAMRVLLELARFPAPDADALYEGARTVDWTEWLTARTTLAVESTLRESALTHSGFTSLKVKDAVVDVLRDKLGERPDVDAKTPDVRIVLHLARDEASLSLDLAGEPLHRRGYRAVTAVAPLKESLAAAVLALGGVEPGLPFLDPMCGSATLAIEHALRARRIAPGLGRAFSFQRWPRYRGGWQSIWDRMKVEAKEGELTHVPAPIVASDYHPKAIAAAQACAQAAGVAADIRIEKADARDARPFAEAGTICTNPPYGERIAGEQGGRSRSLQLGGLYRGFAEALERFHGWDAVLLSGSPLLERELKRKPEISHRLWNGPLEVKLLKYRIR
jgi:putative N6-adenine-specific DNA methylase